MIHSSLTQIFAKRSKVNKSRANKQGKDRRHQYVRWSPSHLKNKLKGVNKSW